MLRLTTKDIPTLIVGELLTAFNSNGFPDLIDEVIQVTETHIELKIIYSSPQGSSFIGMLCTVSHINFINHWHYVRATDEHIHYIKRINTEALIK